MSAVDRGRRRLLALGAASAAGAAGLTPGCGDAPPPGKPAGRSGPHLVVVGGGFAGATCARYARRLAPATRVTLIEPDSRYYTCPFSNPVVGGFRTLDRITQDYAGLADIEIIQDRVTALDPERNSIRTEAGRSIAYDRAVVAPGIDFIWDRLPGLTPESSERVPHAWKAGAQTTRLHDALAGLPTGGVIAMAIPAAPFRCPPGAYERASLMAWYLRQHNPTARILLLDGNDNFSKQALFTDAWESLYPGMIEWIPASAGGRVESIDIDAGVLQGELEAFRFDAASVIPAQHAGAIALTAGLADETGWCPVDAVTLESTQVAGVHVIGDAAKYTPMPKSASAANSQAKHCALAVTALLAGEAVPPPSLHNTCYSLVSPDYGISVSGIYRLEDDAIKAVAGAGGVSPREAPASVRAKEADYARGWYASIVADSFG